jgi:hypothetical protein
MVRKTVKNKPGRMRSKKKNLGPSNSKKPIKKKSLKKKPSKKTKKGVGILNRIIRKINPEYKPRTIVFFYNDLSQIYAFYVKPDSPEEESHALKRFSFNVIQLDLDINNIIKIKEAHELGREEPFKKLSEKISFPINKYSTIPLGKEHFSLKFWGIDEETHQKIKDFFEPKIKQFKEKLNAPIKRPLRHTPHPLLTSGRKFSVSRKENSNNSSRTSILSDIYLN